MKHVQGLEEKINQAKPRERGSSKVKQTPAKFQHKRNKIQWCGGHRHRYEQRSNGD